MQKGEFHGQFLITDGAAEDELTKNNRNAYRKWKLIPDALIDVADVDTETEVLGTKMPYPFALADSNFISFSSFR